MEVREASAEYLAAAEQRVPAGYKQTEVGVIPEDWCGKRFGEIAIPCRLRIDPRKNGVQEFCVELEHIDSATGSLLGSMCTGEQSSLKSVFGTGDVLFGKLRAYLRKYWQADRPGVCSTEIWVLSPIGTLCSSAYLFQIVQTDKFIEAANSSYGTHMPRSDWNVVKNYSLPLPPTKAEQEAIAEALSDADALIESLEQLLTKKRHLKQGAMQELLTGKNRLPGFSGEWEVKRLGSVLRFQVGFPFSSTFFNEACQGIRLVKNRDLKNDDQVFHYSGKYDPEFLVHDGDVLVGMDGDFLPCLWAKGSALLNQRVGRIVPLSGLDRVFAFYYLIKPLKDIENATSSTTVKHLSHGDIEDIENPHPVVQEQIAIATILSEMDAELAALEAKLDKARHLKQGMMQALLTGQIRLPLDTAA